MFLGTFKIKCKLPPRNHWQISKLLIASVSIIDFNLRANESEEVSSVKIKICTEILKYILYIIQHSCCLVHNIPEKEYGDQVYVWVLKFVLFRNACGPDYVRG